MERAAYMNITITNNEHFSGVTMDESSDNLQKKITDFGSLSIKIQSEMGVITKLKASNDLNYQM